MKVLIVLISIAIPICVCSNDSPKVETKSGVVEGYPRTSFEGHQFSAFEGIPYAEPPIGERRFKEAEPKKPWDGRWKANFLTTCPQIDMLGNGVAKDTTEDCLYLNVYVPRTNFNESLNVIVHIHGGGYQYGSGHLYANPEILIDHDVIFVTFNYRLSILGFLSTEDEIVPGNNGLKDQVLALKWVQDNIAAFGGNPKSVTLTGLSAGSCSVHFHYFSELSKGLFYRGVSNSGTALNMWALQKGALEKAQKLGDSLGCPTNNTKVIVECLKQRPVQQIVEKLFVFFEYKILPSAPFAPVVEKEGPNNFLKAEPYKLLIKKEVYDVPWITSTCTHEGASPVLYIPNMIEDVADKWNDLAPFLLEFNYTLSKTLWESTAQKIKEEYLENGFVEKNLLQFIQIFTDRFFVADMETAVRLHANNTKSPIYYYSFNYPGDNNPDKIVGHGADAKYIFGPGPLTPDELKMKDFLVNMLISFAGTGTPKFGNVEWKPTEFEKLTYLNVSGVGPEDVKLETSDELTNRKFWQGLGFQENGNKN